MYIYLYWDICYLENISIFIMSSIFQNATSLRWWLKILFVLIIFVALWYHKTPKDIKPCVGELSRLSHRCYLTYDIPYPLYICHVLLRSVGNPLTMTGLARSSATGCHKCFFSHNLPITSKWIRARAKTFRTYLYNFITELAWQITKWYMLKLKNY